MFHKSFVFSKDTYFLALRNACSLQFAIRHRLSICSSKVKSLSVVIPSKTAFLLSSISDEFTINLMEFHFFFPKIMNRNLPGLACKEFVLNHVNKISYHALHSLKY